MKSKKPERFNMGDDFFAQLEDRQEQAISTAVSYMLRGPGKYVPDPPLYGVDYIQVTCERKYGHLPVSEHDARMYFQSTWESTRKRPALIEKLGLPPTRTTDKSIAFKKYMDEYTFKAKNQSSSADYKVTFNGTAGVWSAVFVIGCVSFDANAVAEVKRSTFEDDGIDDID